MRAFVSNQSAGNIAIALGVALRAEAKVQGSQVGYVKRIGQPAIDRQAVGAIVVQAAEVHLEFERDLATRLAGRSRPDARKAVLVGAGAIGSHLADCLVREGRFHWTIIDDDRLLPHNLARHIARNDQTSRHKAAILADYLNTTLTDEEAVGQPVSANLFATGERGAAIAEALAGARSDYRRHGLRPGRALFIRSQSAGAPAQHVFQSLWRGRDFVGRTRRSRADPARP